MTALLTSLLFANACSDSESESTYKTAPVVVSQNDAIVKAGSQGTPVDEIAKSAEAPPSPTADASCYKGDAFICEIESIIDAETNKLRASSGKTALVHTKEHAFISRSWSLQMAASGQIGHDGFPNERKADYLQEFGKSTNYWAENVAMSNDSGTDAAKIAAKFVTMWWGSAGHKANMLGNYKNIGSGVAKIGNKYYATQLFN